MKKDLMFGSDDEEEHKEAMPNANAFSYQENQNIPQVHQPTSQTKGFSIFDDDDNITGSGHQQTTAAPQSTSSSNLFGSDLFDLNFSAADPFTAPLS